ncbi:kelch-like protein 12 [Branchiostoma floridae]|uniref:Kelch-like protein 12 n=2 Tax=Branchiostoma floridae TaxID=7739 RepID=A0A9J7MT01_BRAFL|nr:kelch-like protein 12 [Branchiostoma floridae]
MAAAAATASTTEEDVCMTPDSTTMVDIKNILPSESYAKSLLVQMNALRKKETLCDVMLVVKGQEFPAHRIVLAAASDYFCAMFTNEMSEKSQSSVELQGLSPRVMEILLDFVYTETVNVTVENVQDLLPAACLLQLKGVKEACCDFLESQLDPSNSLGIMSFADAHTCQSLRRAAEVHTHRHFSDVVQHEEFLLLERDDVEKLLKCDEIQVPSEEPVFEALMQWVKHRLEGRKPYLPELLESVRLPLLTPRYITDVVDKEMLIRRSLECRDLVDVAKRFHLRPELRAEMQGPQTKPRTGASEVMLVIGGFGSQQSPVDTVEKYNPKTEEWEFLPAITKKRRYVASCSLNDRVYVIGGYDGRSRLSTVECLDYHMFSRHKNETWRNISSMTHRRGLASACVMGDHIYVAGGFDGSYRHSSMERYDPQIDRWTVLGDMENGREGAGLIAANGSIYCIGGYDGLHILRSVERYDPNSGQWTTLPSMVTKRSGAGVGLINDTIYVVGGFDGSTHLNSVECFNVRTNQWTRAANMVSARCYVGATVLQGRLYAIAGYDGQSLQSSIEAYDTITDSWEVVSNMATQRCDVGIAVVSEV